MSAVASELKTARIIIHSRFDLACKSWSNLSTFVSSTANRSPGGLSSPMRVPRQIVRKKNQRLAIRRAAARTVSTAARTIAGNRLTRNPQRSKSQAVVRSAARMIAHPQPSAPPAPERSCHNDEQLKVSTDIGPCPHCIARKHSGVVRRVCEYHDKVERGDWQNYHSRPPNGDQGGTAGNVRRRLPKAWKVVG